MLAQVAEFRSQMAESFSDCPGIELRRIALPRVGTERRWNHYFHGHFYFSIVPAEISGLHCGAMANLNSLGRKLLAVVIQTPGSHLLGRAVLHAHNDVAVPWPSMVAIIFAWPRRMVRMRMVPADHFEALIARRLFRGKNVFRSHRKSIARRIVPPIDQRKELQNLPRGRRHSASPIALQHRARITPEKRSATFVWVSLRAMRANLLRKLSADPKCLCIRHGHSSSQKRSFKYFDAESAKIVTITACSSFGIPAATVKHPNSAAAALGLTSKPSSRASRFTSR